MSTSTFTRVRVGFLLFVLLGVVLWALRDVHSRKARTDWDHTLDVAIVVVRTGDVDPLAVERLRERTKALEDRLATELRRHRPGAPRPFAFTVFGPVEGTEPPAIVETGLMAAAQHGIDLWKYTRDLDERAAVRSGFDSRIYVAVRAPATRDKLMVEGDSEDGGRVGTVRVELDTSMADFALAVIAHELFHTLGASDKYDASGRIARPAGLAEPELDPLYPQRYAEIMTRGRAVSETAEEIPASIDDAVGPATAREVGWVGSP